MSKIQPFENVKFLKEMYGLPDAAAVQQAIPLLCKILTFLNGCILLTIGSTYTKLGAMIS